MKEGDHLEDQDIYLVDNIKVHRKEIDCEGMEWINLAEDSDKCHVVVIMITSSSIKCRKFLD